MQSLILLLFFACLVLSYEKFSKEYEDLVFSSIGRPEKITLNYLGEKKGYGFYSATEIS